MSGDGINVTSYHLENELRILQKIYQNRIFLGHYQERRYVEILQTYRDVVLVHASESELKVDLENTRKNIIHATNKEIWIGISVPKMLGAPVGHALWVKMKELAFGLYWFKIKKIKLSDDKEIIFQLKMIRKVEFDHNPVINNETFQTTTSTETSASEAMAQYYNEWRNYDYKEKLFQIILNISTVLTMKNLYEGLCFLSALGLTLSMAAFQSLHYIGEYSLKLIREFSILIHSLTPVILGLIDMFAKIIGGFYLLIAMIWNSSQKRQSTGKISFPTNLLSLPPSSTMSQSSSSGYSLYRTNSMGRKSKSPRGGLFSSSETGSNY